MEKLNTDFNRARKRWWRVSREREYILLINLTIHLDTHTRKLRKLKRTSKTEI